VTALYIIIGVFALIAIFLILRIGIVAQYSDDGFMAEVIAGPRSIRLYPRPPKEKKPKKEKKPEKRPPKRPEPEKKGGKIDDFRDIWAFARNIILRLRLRLRVDELIIHIMAAGEDPVAVALSYGGVSAAMGMITPVLEHNFNIKKRDIKSTFSFELKEPCIYLRAKLTMAIWQVLYVGLPVILDYMKTKRTKEERIKELRKEEK